MLVSSRCPNCFTMQKNGAPQGSLDIKTVTMTSSAGRPLDVLVAQQGLVAGEVAITIPEELTVTLGGIFESEFVGECVRRFTHGSQRARALIESLTEQRSTPPPVRGVGVGRMVHLRVVHTCKLKCTPECMYQKCLEKRLGNARQTS